MRGRDGRIVGGDVITAVNGKPVGDLDELLNELEERQVGDKVTLSVWNGGKTRQVQAQLTSD
jgi:S1-C subfamily serine protease